MIMTQIDPRQTAALLAAQDDQVYQEHQIKTVEPCEGTGDFELAVEDGGCLCVQNKLEQAPPVPGDLCRFYGRGFGYPVRGVSVLKPTGEVFYYYATEDEYVTQRAIEAQRHRAAQRKEFDANRADWETRVAALPTPFGARIAFFRRNPEWEYEHGGYELFTCEEAVKIAGAMKTVEGVKALHDAADSHAVMPSLSHEHTGNTLGVALMLAHMYIRNEDGGKYVMAFHGALCGLVGCKDYGCYSGTPEAQAEREARAVSEAAKAP